MYKIWPCFGISPDLRFQKITRAEQEGMSQSSGCLIQESEPGRNHNGKRFQYQFIWGSARVGILASIDARDFHCTIRTTRITPHHFIFQELISVIISLPITPKKFWDLISAVPRKNYTTLFCPY